jgi:hypothetical protein
MTEPVFNTTTSFPNEFGVRASLYLGDHHIADAWGDDYLDAIAKVEKRLAGALSSLIHRGGPMTRDELLTSLRALQGDHVDPEQAHCEADALLLMYIGDPEIEEAYERIEKWYA